LQAPLGGPDDKKDILARRNGLKYVCGVYFPPTRQSFGPIETKFVEDRQGVERHGADGFVFLVNQPLKMSERKSLLGLGDSADELFHLERQRLALDSPKGYGLRLEFLQQPMTVEEQISFFSALEERLVHRLLADRREARETNQKLDFVVAQTTAISERLGVPVQPSTLGGPDVIGPTDAPISRLSIADLLLIHRALTEDTQIPDDSRGSLRSIQVVVGTAGDPVYLPPPPEEVPDRLISLLTWWEEAYERASVEGLPTLVAVLARLHYELLSIHPFVDANGRVARFVADQAAREIADRGISQKMTGDRALYAAALNAADDEDLEPLEDLVRAALI